MTTSSSINVKDRRFMTGLPWLVMTANQNRHPLRFHLRTMSVSEKNHFPRVWARNLDRRELALRKADY
jgi:hypothetical protein